MTVLPTGRSGCRLPADPTTRIDRTPRAMASSSAITAAGAPAGNRATAIGSPPDVFPTVTPVSIAVPSDRDDGWSAPTRAIRWLKEAPWKVPTRTGGNRNDAAGTPWRSHCSLKHLGRSYQRR